jgi:N-acetylglutamate synthase-like GNAT family acetyltransferase
MMYLGAEWYLENFFIAEHKEQYRVNSAWHAWAHLGLLRARAIDDRLAGAGSDWEIRS